MFWNQLKALTPAAHSANTCCTWHYLQRPIIIIYSDEWTGWTWSRQCPVQMSRRFSSYEEKRTSALWWKLNDLRRMWTSGKNHDNGVRSGEKSKDLLLDRRWKRDTRDVSNQEETTLYYKVKTAVFDSWVCLFLVSFFFASLAECHLCGLDRQEVEYGSETRTCPRTVGHSASSICRSVF